MMGEKVIKISQLTVVYGKETVLDLPELELEAGRVHVLVGPNGAGKTTLLRIISGLERPATGRMTVFGRDLYGLSYRERRQVMRRMTFCFQKPYLFNTTVRRNVEYGLSFRKIDESEKNEKNERVTSVLKTLNLMEFGEHSAPTLSAGEMQRVSLARALVLEPELALLDEPIANVDEANIAQVEAAIFALQERGSTVLVATHHLDQAYRLSANVVRLERGRIAPPALENILEGKVVGGNGAAVFVLGGGLSIYVTTEKRGFIRASVDPDSIIVSKERFQSSARNCFPGKVVALSVFNQLFSVVVDIGVRLTAHITKESFDKLGVTIGGDVFMTFKASSVVVF